MQDKTSSKEKTKGQDSQVADIAEQAARNYEQALRTGMKFQQEARQWWNGLLDQGASAEDWQKRATDFTALADSLRPATQKRMQEVLDLVEKNSRTGTEILRKAGEAAQAPAMPQSQSKWMDVWTSSLSAARYNAEAALQIQTRAMETWIEFIEKSAHLGHGRAGKAI